MLEVSTHINWKQTCSGLYELQRKAGIMQTLGTINADKISTTNNIHNFNVGTRPNK